MAPPDCRRPGPSPPLTAAVVNGTFLLSVLVVMTAITKATRSELPCDADAAVRQLYSLHAEALHGYVERFT